MHTDKEEATDKAIHLTRAMVEKVKYNRPLTPINIPVTRRALVIGGGIVYTFIKAMGGQIGDSLVEDDYVQVAQAVIDRAAKNQVRNRFGVIGGGVQ